MSNDVERGFSMLQYRQAIVQHRTLLKYEAPSPYRGYNCLCDNAQHTRR
jgi:hypothetical protein